MRGRKSQATMEFLMNYGWAILVVGAAIAALAHFGVLNPARFLPQECGLPPTSGIACLDFELSPASADLLLANSRDSDLIINNISVGACFANFSYLLVDSSSYIFSLSGCSFGSSGDRVKEALVVSYTDVPSNFTKPAVGSVTAMLS
jgi:hypothetical protein